MDLKAQTAIAQSRLSLPSAVILKPWLEKLIANPGSCIIIAVESPLAPEGPHVSHAWLSSIERAAIRKALTSLNAKRIAKGEPSTSQVPQSHATQKR